MKRWLFPAIASFGFFVFAHAASATVAVVSPNGGECLTVGQPYTVQVPHDTVHVAVYYRTDGLRPRHVDFSIIQHPQFPGSFSWTPTIANVSEAGRIWVEGHNADHSSTGQWDSSNANFSVRVSCIPSTLASQDYVATA